MRSTTWRELEEEGERLAAGYRGLRLEPGDRIASLMPNRNALIVHCGARALPPSGEIKQGSIGRPSGFSVALRGEDDEPVEAESVGRIFIRTESARTVEYRRLARTRGCRSTRPARSTGWA